MDTLNLPTKRNLLLARQRLALARKGYDLLDKKRQVLISELAQVQVQAKQVREDMQNNLDMAHKALSAACMEMGRERVQDICHNMPKDAATEILFCSIMGVELPLVNRKQKLSQICYKLSDTTASFDEAVLAWQGALQLIISAAAMENTVHRLQLHIKKTQKRANALGNITIPMYEARIKFIQERLEERERDELARLKLAKSRRAPR